MPLPRITPTSLTEQIQIVERYHQFGCFGPRAIYQHLTRDNFHWPGMNKQIVATCGQCHTCAHWNPGKRVYHPPRTPHSAWPFDLVHLDICTSFDSVEHDDIDHSYFLVITDQFTSFSILEPLVDKTAKSVARALYKTMCLFGPPRVIQSDGGGEFTADIVRALISDFGIDHRIIIPYSPMSAGKVESHVKLASTVLRKLMHAHGTQNWPALLPLVQLIINSKFREGSHSSPFALIFNRTANHLQSFAQDENIPPVTDAQLAQWELQQRQFKSDTIPLIRRYFVEHSDSSLEDFAKTHKVTSKKLQTGSTVMIFDVRRASKNEPPWIGPYTVARVDAIGHYELHDAAGGLFHRTCTRDMLKPLPEFLQSGGAAPASYVDRITAHRRRNGITEYLAEWRDGSDSTWEPASSFDDIESLLKTYFANKKILPKRPSHVAPPPVLPVLPKLPDMIRNPSLQAAHAALARAQQVLSVPRTLVAAVEPPLPVFVPKPAILAPVSLAPPGRSSFSSLMSLPPSHRPSTVKIPPPS